MKPTISFEYFPPKSAKAEEDLWMAIPVLKDFKPKFMTVTYGAGGSTHEGTVSTLKRMMEGRPVPLAAHLTFINSRKEDLKSYAQELWDMGVKHILALRGDMPDDADVSWPLEPDDNYFQYTSDFVEDLKTWNDFEVSVGAYPEKHPDSPSLAQDMLALKYKMDAGADRAISQFFFDNDVYLQFVEVCQNMGIDKPIVPGLLPIHDFKSLCNFAKKCGANVPDWLHNKFEGLENNPEDAQKVAIEILYQQAQDLIDRGVPHIHFYTLNKSAIVKDVCQLLG